tara:strand:- start:1517 stop:1750 length:234 start_codon:yes stop_codon:yes gene_type:complete
MEFKRLEQINYESALFALAHGVDYETLGDIMDEALEQEAYEVVSGVERAILAHSKTGNYNCKVRPSVDTEDLELPYE